jgi:hypothetical protein
MEHNIKMHESGEFFITAVSGTITVTDSTKYINNAREFSEKHNVDLTLFDARNAINGSTVIDNYNFAYKDNILQEIDKTKKMAILISEDDKSHDFALTAVKNAGYNIEVFYDFDKAVEWLTT